MNSIYICTMKVPFSPPRIDDIIINEVSEALRSGWITTGPRTKLFEEKITEYCGNKKTLCLNSATAGLELMLRWFGVKQGDEVIVPAYTYCATANVVEHCGASVVFVDVNQSDFNINIDAVRKAITSKTKAIIPVDFAGWACDYDALNSLINEVDIKNLFNPENEHQTQLGRILLMADAAHSFGAFYKGKSTGSLCDVSVFSFHAVKNLTTAEGGAVALNFENFDNEEIYKTLNRMSLHGQSKDALAKFSGKGNWEYDVLEAGFKCNMTDIHAAIGLIEIGRYKEETLPARQNIFEFYAACLSEHEWAELPIYEVDNSISSFHVFPLRIKNCSLEQRNRIIQKIFDKDVSVNVHFKPVPMMTAYTKLGYDIANYPQAYENFACEISLPVYFGMSDEQMNWVMDAVIESVEEEFGIVHEETV